MKHLGDITNIYGTEIEPVNVISFGSPCQDLSVANGKRAGLSGDRSGLFMEAVRIIKEMRENDRRVHPFWTDDMVRPKFAIWENVPGAFSSNKGEDFRCVLEELVHIAEPTANVPRPDGKWNRSGCVIGDNWSLAWRLFDAQYWGVPQRRKRIALLCDFNGLSAPNILLTEYFRSTPDADREPFELGDRGRSFGKVQLEPESLSRDLEPCIKTWKGIARCPEESLGVDSYTLKIRGGVDIDSKGKKAGKGALVQTELSGTMGVSQDQTLFLIDRN